MRELSYSGGTVITSDEAAEAVLAYAAALANHDRAATVHIPAVGLAAGGTTVEMLVGPASQLASFPIESDEEEPAADAFVAELQSLIDELDRRWVTHDRTSLDFEL